MMERIYRIFGISGIIFVFVTFLTSCATVDIPRQAHTEESLRNTASLYWKMRGEGKYKDTYKMEEKEQFTKWKTQGLSLYDYYKTKAAIAGSVTSISVEDAYIVNETGRANVKFTLTLPQTTRPFHQMVTDEWIFKNGKWLHLFPL